MTEGSPSPQSLRKSSEQGEKGGVRRPIFHKNRAEKFLINTQQRDLVMENSTHGNG